MLDFIKAITPITIVAVVLILAIVFRKEIQRIVGWIVSFKQIAKTKDGFAMLPLGSPDVVRVETIESETAVAVAAAQSGEPTASAMGATSATTDHWAKAFFEKRYDDAIRALESEAEAEADKEKRLQDRSMIGHILFQKNAMDGAAYFENLIDQFPTSQHSYLWYALTLSWKNLIEQSLHVIDRGLAKADYKATLFETKSDILKSAGQLDDAFKASRSGVDADPTYVENYLNLVRIEAQRNNKDSARGWYRRALGVSHAAETILAGYALWLYENDFTEEAILRYHSLVGQFPTNSTYRGYYGNALLKAGYSDLALEEYLKANELADGKEAWILANIGNVYKNARLFARAAFYLKEALKIDPDSQYALDRLSATLKAEEDQSHKRTELLDKALSDVIAMPLLSEAKPDA